MGHSIPNAEEVLDRGRATFSVEGRVLRELGERLVKKPEVAVLELIKNSFDADATACTIDARDSQSITVTDNGRGMTLAEFSANWMCVGTGIKAKQAETKQFRRVVTGDKGIGRFAVRFLGTKLELRTVARDSVRSALTRLRAEFDWKLLDDDGDLQSVSVPYTLEAAEPTMDTGTTLRISELRVDVDGVDWRQVRTGSMGVVSPFHTLLESKKTKGPNLTERAAARDPGFDLSIMTERGEDLQADVAGQILDSCVLRAEATLSASEVEIRVFEGSHDRPELEVVDRLENDLGGMRAELRFFPRRSGTFQGAGVDGRRAYRWIKANSGVAVFDRGFRILPYGMEGDDWLQLTADAASNKRDPRSAISRKHFGMDPARRNDTSENWMLRLPQSAQLVGVVQVQGGRSSESRMSGLIVSADREGFVDNLAFRQLFEVVRASAEMIAVADRIIQRREEAAAAREIVEQSRGDTRAAVREIEGNRDLSVGDKKRIVGMLLEAHGRIERQETSVAERESQLEIMSLLGVVAGYMTHEFGLALSDLRDAEVDLSEMGTANRKYAQLAEGFRERVRRLGEFAKYSRAYIEGTRRHADSLFYVKPRIRQIIKLLGQYAHERGVKIEVGVDERVQASGVPVTLYNGVLQNLYTNALKAVSARAGSDEMTIAFRGWNDKHWHYLQVSDTGVGIPQPLRERVFDPLFSTNAASVDPLGSGMGLGLSLVRRCAEAFGGSVRLVQPPAGFSTCIEFKLPISGEAG